MRSVGLLAVAVLVFAAPISESHGTDPLRLYQIGNSLTWDTAPTKTEANSVLLSDELDVGYHIRNNSSLDRIWNDPNGADIASDDGQFTPALTDAAWDAVTLQPYYSSTSTLGQSLDRIDDFVSLADQNPDNQNTQWYLYAAFAPRSAYPAGDWEQAFVDDPESSTVYSRSYFDVVMTHLETRHPGRFLLIPGGHAVNRVHLAIESGQAPWFNSVADIYRDPVHMGVGSFMMSTLVHSSVTGRNPIGDPVNRGQDGWGDGLPDDMALFFQEIVWDVLLDTPGTGLGSDIPADFDGDSAIGPTDLGVWSDTYGSAYLSRADANGDGVVNAADYTVWRDGLNAVQAGDLLVAVPEPTTGFLSAAALASLLARRRV